MAGSAAQGYYCHGDSQTKLVADTDDDDDDPFGSDIEADLEEDEAVIEDE